MMSDQLNFEMRLDAAVKAFAASADQPVDAQQIAAAALHASRNTGWWTRLASVSQPRTGGLPGLNVRPLLIVLLAIVAIGAVSVGMYWQRSIIVGPPAPTATPSALPGQTGAATPAPTATAPSTVSWTGQVRSDAGAMPVLGMSIDGDARLWVDDEDAEPGWADLTELRWTLNDQMHWWLELAAKPPLARDIDPSDTLIEYGLVFDMNGDGVADYVVGINNDAPGEGHFRVWVTDLGTGTTEEQVGPPYGFPVEFSHPDETRPDDGPFDEPTVLFTFLGGTRPADLDASARYYAWASVTVSGEVVAWDYAPDFGWLAGAPTISVQRFSASVSRGEVATLSVKTEPGAQCFVELTYASGPSDAAGLEPKEADESGSVSWSWEVGLDTTPGTYPLDIHCSQNGNPPAVLAESLLVQAAEPSPSTLPALPLPGYGPSRAGDYGWTGARGYTAGMHRVVVKQTGSSQTQIWFAIEDDCFAYGTDGEPVPLTVAGLDARYFEPYLDPNVTFIGRGAPRGAETTGAYALSIGDRTLCVYLTWDPTTTQQELEAARQVVESIRGQPFGSNGIRIIFTLPEGWDRG